MRRKIRGGTIIKVLILACFTLIYISCKKDKTADKTESVNDEYFLDQKQASTVGLEFNNKLLAGKRSGSLSNGKNNSGTAVNMTGKTVENITPVKDSQGLNAYYIINYNEGGFSIVSADKRTLSIMAYSESGKFKTDIVPEGVSQWLSFAKTVVDSVRKTKVKYTGQDVTSRNLLLKASLPATVKTNSEPEPEPGCSSTSEVVGPLLTTQWSQNEGYNSNCPALACGPGGHAYTGCTTTAIAQIAKYHQFPTSYNYSLMPDIGASSETARLMGNIFSVTIEEFNCEVGSSSTMDKTLNTLRNYLGYSGDIRKLNYSGTSNYDLVKNEIRANRPVIFSGGNKGNWFIFPVYKGGHEWVCDGFVETWNCGYGQLVFHMNWGWSGQYDGFYSLSGFNPGSNDFNYKSQIIVGIHR
ncbi:C10 family peptidase [Pedobacter sp. PAMC26386]|nr:C10 family peptidase [Pedobacter sp. PAMC26386]